MNLLTEIGIPKKKFDTVRAWYEDKFGRLSIVGILRVMLNEKYDEIVNPKNNG